MSARSTAPSSGRRAAAQGHGFDPVFMPQGYDITFGEMPPEMKHSWAPGKIGLSRTAPRPSACSSMMFWEVALSTETLGHNSVDPRSNGLFGIYVHWPFCAAKCPCCDFNSHVHRGEFDEARPDVEAYAPRARLFRPPDSGRTVQSIFFGGGTRSLMDPRSVAAILDAFAGHWVVDPRAEIALERPTRLRSRPTVSRGYRAAGVNRVSLGVQSLREGPLAEARPPPHRWTRRSARCGWRNPSSRARASISSTPAPPDAGGLGRRADRGAVAGRGRGTCRSTSSPSSRARAIYDLFRAGKLKMPDEDTSADLYELTQN